MKNSEKLWKIKGNRLDHTIRLMGRSDGRPGMMVDGGWWTISLMHDEQKTWLQGRIIGDLDRRSSLQIAHNGLNARCSFSRCRAISASRSRSRSCSRLSSRICSIRAMDCDNRGNGWYSRGVDGRCNDARTAGSGVRWGCNGIASNPTGNGSNHGDGGNNTGDDGGDRGDGLRVAIRIRPSMALSYTSCASLVGR